MMAPKVHKFGILGTSCAGKTTLAHGIVARLKSYGILADGLFSQDRRFSFDRQYLETEVAQNWMITNLIAKEVDMVLHGDHKVLITDRTPIDLFAYYAHQFNTKLSKACWEYCLQWANTYDALYYLEPLPFQADGKRPPDDFRLQVDRTLQELLQEVPQVKRLTRHEVLNDILKVMDFKKPTVKTSLSLQDVQALATHIGYPVVVKDIEKPRDTLGDYDLWVLVSPGLRDTPDLQQVRDYAQGLFGQFVQLDINLTAGLETFDFQYDVLTPQGAPAGF